MYQLSRPYRAAPGVASLVVVAACAGLAAWAVNDGWQSGIPWKRPPVVTPGDAAPAPAPSDAVVLFATGGDLAAWTGGEWSVDDEGTMLVGKGALRTKESFGDCQLHLEFATPAEVRGDGQGRGNSGVFFMGQYELQILDSFENDTYADGQAGAMYKQRPPMVNASRPPGQWQSYDVVFRAPRFNADGTLERPAQVTAFHNGVLIHHAVELGGRTRFDAAPSYEAHPAKLPLILQEHGNPVRFRNIWIRPLDLDDASQRDDGPGTLPATAPATRP